MMTRWFVAMSVACALVGGLCACHTGMDSPTPARAATTAPRLIPLPAPRTTGDLALETALARRRSVRAFTDEPLTLEQVSQLLWAAQGITDPRGFRTAPSAGGLYPLELYVLTADGVYHYLPSRHALAQLSTADLRLKAWEHGLRQEALHDAPVIFVLCAVYARTEAKYGARATRYVHLEAGHAAQNLMLQAVALGLGGVTIGAFYDDRLVEALSLPADHAPLYLIPMGYPEETP